MPLYVAELFGRVAVGKGYSGNERDLILVSMRGVSEQRGGRGKYSHLNLSSSPPPPPNYLFTYSIHSFYCAVDIINSKIT